MNTPPTIKRHKLPQLGPYEDDEGGFTPGITAIGAATNFAKIVNGFVHLESQMQDLLAVLMNEEGDDGVAGYVWKAILNPKAKIELMEALLTKAPVNQALDAEFDEIIREFRAVSKIRNDYVHGLWWTRDKDRSLWLSRPNEDEHSLTILVAKQEPELALHEASERIDRLLLMCFHKCHREKRTRREAPALPEAEG